MYVYIYRKKLRVRWRTLLKCTNQTDFSGLHVLAGTEYQSLIHFAKWSLFFHLPYPPPFKIKPQHNEGGGMLESLNKNKIASSHTLSFLQTRKRERGGGKKTPKQNSYYFQISTPCKVPSFFFLFFFLIWLLRTKDPKSRTDCIYTIWNVKMSMCFYVHNSTGKDSLDLWSCSHRMNVKGGGEGRPTASCHIYIKNRPFSARSYITEFEILSTTTLDENHRIFLKITPT